MSESGVSETALKELRIKLRSPELYTVTRDNLLPSAQAVYDERSAQLGYKPPIFVDNTLGVNHDHARLTRLPDNTRGFVVSERAHRWDEAFVRDKVAFEDEHFSKMTPYKNGQVVAAFEKMAKEQGFDPVPVLLEGRAEAHMSRSGKFYITIEPTLEADKAIGIIAHELGHIKNGDVGYARRAEMHNHPERKIHQEGRADDFAVRIGLGPELTSALVSTYADTKHLARKDNATAEEYEAFHNPHKTHPLLMDRIRSAVNGMSGIKDATATTGPESAPKVPDCRTSTDKGCQR